MESGPRSLFGSFILFYKITKSYLRSRLYIYMLLNILSVVAESIGLLLFIPLFQTLEIDADDSDRVSRFIHHTFDALGIEVSVTSSLVLLVCAFILKGFAIFAIGAYREYLTSQLKFDLREKLVKSYSTLDYRYALGRSTGYFGNLIIGETDRALGTIDCFSRCLTCLITTSIFLATALWVYPQLSAIILVAGIVNILLLRYVSKLARRYSGLASQYNARLNELLIELLQSVKYLKATAQFPSIRRLIRETNRKTARLHIKHNLANSAYQAVREPILVIFIAALIFYYVVVQNQGIGVILVPILFLYRCMLEAGFLQNYWQTVCDLSGGLLALHTTFKDFEINKEPIAGTEFSSFKESIEFQNVSFSYNTTPVLEDINIRIPKYTSVALVGASGVGKTTFVDLLTGILPPGEGKILLDGSSLTTQNLNTYRSKIGYVVQDTVIFSDTIANNISMQLGSKTSPETMLKVRKAAKLSHVHEFVCHLQDGYETIVGEKGATLSGGQRQRLAIARELFKEPEILILDESTSALDSESERFIQQSIADLKGKTTVVIISHRLSTVRHVDNIYVIEDGRIVEEGNFEKLSQMEEGWFRRIYGLQRVI